MRRSEGIQRRPRSNLELVSDEAEKIEDSVPEGFNQPHNPSGKMFLSISETAKLTGLSETFIRRMKKADQLPGVYCGRRFLVNIDIFLGQIVSKNAVKLLQEEPQEDAGK